MKKETLDSTSAVVPLAPAASLKPTQDYSFETVAGVAVHLLKNGNHAAAAKDAIELLDACRNELATRARHAAIWAKARSYAQAKDAHVKRGQDGKPYLMKWRELYEYVTGDVREDRAMPKLRKVLNHWLCVQNAIRFSKDRKEIPPADKKWIDTKLAELKREGVYSGSALGLREIWELINPRKNSQQKKAT